MTSPQSAIDWSGDHLRVSLFSDATWVGALEGIFADAFHCDPEAVTTRPIANESSATGQWNGARLEIKKTFNRIDFILQAMPVEPMPIALLNDISALLPLFSGELSRWVVSQPQPINRLAIGTRGFLPSASVQDSYIKLRSLVRVINIDVDRFKEFTFQVNLPVESSSVQGIRLNRLSNWASLVVRAGLISMENAQYFDERYFVTCGIDINTEAERTAPYDRESLPLLLNELSQRAIQILTSGIE